MTGQWTTRMAVLALLASLGAQAAAASRYDFNGDLTDSLGNGPALIANGGTVSGGEYVFGAGQGLSLDWSGFDAATYDLSLRFSLSSVGPGVSWRRIVDFKERTKDEGLYAFADKVQFVETASSTANPEILLNGPDSVFAPNQPVTLRLVRDGATDAVDIYIDGTLQVSFTDSRKQAVFTGATPIANFFIDDFVVGGEISGGSLDFISVNVAPVPVPAALPLLGGALLVLTQRRRRA